MCGRKAGERRALRKFGAMEADFTHRGYLELLNNIKALGYPLGPFREFPGAAPFIILRHDVDYSLHKAREMAILDQQASVNSTFFILMTSPFYNALSHESIQIVREIASMGNEIGLHYDCRGFEKLTPLEQRKRVSSLIQCLEIHAGVQVTTLAEHKAAETNIRLELPGYVDAYSPNFTKDIPYIRDSAMTLTPDIASAFFRDNHRAQLLIHPVWWHNERRTIEGVFENIRELALEHVDQMIAQDEKSIEQWLERQGKYRYVPWEKPQYRHK